MKLIIDIIRKQVSEYDEGRFNKEFPIFHYYQIIIQCAIITKQEIDIQYINELYTRYQKARYDGNREKIRHYITELKKESIKNHNIIKAFIDTYKDVEMTETPKAGLWRKDAIGYLVSEED